MTSQSRHDAWASGDNYERYMGRWSRQIAPRFLAWLEAPPARDWLDVGCGTGALSAAIASAAAPNSLLSIDPSPAFLDKARADIPDPRVTFAEGGAEAIPAPDASRDIVVSGLVLNFVPDRDRAFAEMKRVARPGGIVAYYVWDYPGGGVEFMRAFWQAAIALDAAAADLTEDKRFPFCTQSDLAEFATRAGLAAVDSTAIEAPTVFRDFDDVWQPFTLGTGPAPGYCASLAPHAREALKERLRASLPTQPDGTIHLKTRAWAVRGRVA